MSHFEALRGLGATDEQAQNYQNTYDNMLAPKRDSSSLKWIIGGIVFAVIVILVILWATGTFSSSVYMKMEEEEE